MRSTKRIVFALFYAILCLLFVFGNSQSQKSAAEIFDMAFYYEDVQGDLQKAIELYEQILKQFPENRKIAAKAQFQIGMCYEKLGLNEAQKAYQNVVDNYPDQVEEAKLAREKLTSLSRAKTDMKELKIQKVLEGQIVVYSSVSPDGRYYAYPDWGKGGNLAVRNFATGKSRALTEDKGGFAFDARWSSDGKNLAYAWTDWSDISLKSKAFMPSHLTGLRMGSTFWPFSQGNRFSARTKL